jgi:diadenosine tetraphosphate (Ap4A) HIT family hydrolase
MTGAVQWQLHPQLEADTRFVASLGLSELRLMDDAQYPWLILVPRVTNAIELVDLDETQQVMLMREITQTSHALRSLFEPDKLNVAALGNVVSQLHVHVVARFHGDAAWPRPIWGVVPPQPCGLEVREQRLQALRAMFNK